MLIVTDGENFDESVLGEAISFLLIVGDFIMFFLRPEYASKLNLENGLFSNRKIIKYKKISEQEFSTTLINAFKSKEVFLSKIVERIFVIHLDSLIYR